MLQRILSYIKFVLNSTNQHGVHSPFVFDLLTKCLYKKASQSEIEQLNKFRHSLASNHKYITIEDFGAGSKIFSSNQRKISKMVRHVSISKKRARLLYQLTNYFKPKNILEIGTSLGLATSALSYGNPKSSIITLEGCTETAKTAKEMFDKHELTNIKLVQGNFSDTYFSVIKKHIFDLIYFDGNHTKEATLKYFNACLPYTDNDSILIFDDIHWSSEMEEAWEEIKMNPEVTVTIDTYQWGLVFLRKEQQKEHFTLRV